MQKHSPNPLALFSVFILTGFTLTTPTYAGEHDVNHTRPKPTKPSGSTKPSGEIVKPANAGLVNNENVFEATAITQKPKPTDTPIGNGPTIPVDVPAKPTGNGVLVNNENVYDVRGGTPQGTASSSRKRKKVEGPFDVKPDGYGMWNVTYEGSPLPGPQMTMTEAEDKANDFNKNHNKGNKGDKFMDTGEVTPGGPLK